MVCSNNYKKWTQQQDKCLKSLYDSFKNFKHVAEKLERTEDAVKARYVKLYIVPEYTKEYLTAKLVDIAKHYNIAETDFIRYLKYVGVKYQQPIISHENPKKIDIKMDLKIKVCPIILVMLSCAILVNIWKNI